MVKLVFFSFLDLFPLRFIFNLSVSHLFFKINFSLVFILLFFFSLLIESGLLLLQSVVLLCFFLFALFFSAFFFHLLVELFLYLFLELFLSHSLQLLFLLEQLCIKLDESGPFIIVIALDLIYWLRRYWTGLWVFWWICWRLALMIGRFDLAFLWWNLAFLISLVVSLNDLLFWCCWLCFLRMSFF